MPKIFSKEFSATWKYHLWVSLFLYLTLATYGWNYLHLNRLGYILQRYPLHFFANWALALSISYFLSLVIRRKVPHLITLFTVFLIVATVSREKFEALGMPLLAVDFSLGKYSDLLSEYITLKKVALFLYGYVLLFTALNWHRRGRPSLMQKLRALPELKILEPRSLIVALFALRVGYALVDVGRYQIKDFHLRIRPEDPVANYLANGDLGSLALSVYSKSTAIKRYALRPELLQTLGTGSAKHSLAPGCATKETPDILVVMVESMFDPIQIPAIKFSEDPLAPLRNMGYPESKSYFFVPSYAGQTANTEFEFLTGASHRFFPLGTVQYQNHLFTPANSIARMLAPKNYHSIAVHNFRREFWRRNEVYPLLGFQEFYGLEDMRSAMNVDVYDSGKPQDRALATFVPNQMKKHEDRPGFYFVVTMGTHGPYEKYLLQAGSDIKLTDSVDLSPKSLAMLGTYTNFLADSSKALGDLFRYALGRSKPTVVVFFGDHLPGVPLDTYNQTGYLDWMKREVGLQSDQHKIVPVRVLNNFGCEIKLPKAIASNCMAANLVSQLYADMPSDQFWKYNLEFCQKHPFIFDGVDAENLEGDMADYAGMVYQSLFKWQSPPVPK